MSRRLSWILPLLALLAAAGWFAWRRYAPPEVSIVQPSRGVAIDAVYATGLVEPTLEIRIAPRTPGRIVELLVDEGATVRAGQLLARLEDSDLRASVAELEARVEYAQSQFDRNTELRRSSLISQDALDRSRTDLARRGPRCRSRATGRASCA
jgi:multidrug efflux pump subunit AcrA (membrane-fusion protein)